MDAFPLLSVQLFIICVAIAGLGFMVFCLEWVKGRVATVVIEYFARKMSKKIHLRKVHDNHKQARKSEDSSSVQLVKVQN